MAEPELAQRVRAGDRRALGQAITLVESQLPEHQLQAERLLTALLPFTGGSHRVAFTGAPGAGKSTLVDTLGAAVLAAGRSVAVLAIDPASSISGGSLLGDAVRMQRLSASERAFVRASSNLGTLGGTAPATAQAVLLCEAAGFELVLVETVGVGQAEQAARDLVDTLVVLTLAGGGDEIQGLKRGLLEVADAVVVNKADGAREESALAHSSAVAAALGLLRPHSAPYVLATSAVSGRGVPELLAWLTERVRSLGDSGQLAELRREQLGRAFRAALSRTLSARALGLAGSAPELATLESSVREGQKLPSAAARELVDALLERA